MKYYTDEELLDLVRNVGDSKDSYEWIADKIGQRFNQKNSTISNLQQRVNVAAEHMGHNLINELIDEGY